MIFTKVVDIIFTAKTIQFTWQNTRCNDYLRPVFISKKF